MKIFGIVGWKNSGKTGLMERLVSDMTARGLKVSTIKHAHHSFDVDHVGRDSYRHRFAGASEVMLASNKRWALMHELRSELEPTFNELLAKMLPVDLILVEGFKKETHAKLECYREEVCDPLLINSDDTISVLASDIQIQDINVPVFDLNYTLSISDFILKHQGLL